MPSRAAWLRVIIMIMGYQFRGFFAEFADGLVESAAQQWPMSRARVLHEPFYGVGLRLHEPDDMKTEEEIEKLLSLEDELPSWTKNFPETTVVYIYADCFGGHCEYEGFVCKNGEKLSVKSGDKALTRLLSHLGIKLNDKEFFEPFERSYRW